MSDEEEYKWSQQEVNDLVRALSSQLEGSNRARIEAVKILKAALAVPWASRRGGPNVRALRDAATALVMASDALGPAADADAQAIVPQLLRQRAMLVGDLTTASQVSQEFIREAEKMRDHRHMTLEYRNARDGLQLLADALNVPELEADTLVPLDEVTMKRLTAPPEVQEEEPVDARLQEIRRALGMTNARH